jgi:hypothetical protein
VQGDVVNRGELYQISPGLIKGICLIPVHRLLLYAPKFLPWDLPSGGFQAAGMPNRTIPVSAQYRFGSVSPEFPKPKRQNNMRRHGNRMPSGINRRRVFHSPGQYLLPDSRQARPLPLPGRFLMGEALPKIAQVFIAVERDRDRPPAGLHKHMMGTG